MTHRIAHAPFDEQLSTLDRPPAALTIEAGPQTCRACGRRLHPFVDLGLSPLARFRTAAELDSGETFYPLAVRICPGCWLAQLPEHVAPHDIFREDALFSSYARDTRTPSRDDVAATIGGFEFNPRSFVVQVASRDGHLLRDVVARGIPCLGIEPALGLAQAAMAGGVPTMTAFFSERLARELAEDGKQADILIANYVLAQVPALNDFAAGLAAILKPEGVLTIEVPHLMRLIADIRLDTIRHEHLSYFSLASLEATLGRHGLRVFDVEEIWTRGGSLRVFACHCEAHRAEAPSVAGLRAAEESAGLHDLATYRAFQDRAVETRHRLLELLIELKGEGKRIVGYGAAGTATTLLNYCGIRSDVLDFIVDDNPDMHGRHLPGTRIPVLPPEALDQHRPDYVLILPQPLSDGIPARLAPVRAWGGRFILPLPVAEIVA